MSSKGLRFDELLIDYTGLPSPDEFRARDGERLSYRHYPAQSDRHLILVHGSGYHSRYLFPLARAIAEQNAAQVYTPDVRGHGVNPKRRGDVDYLEQLEDDLADLVGRIRERHPDAEVVVGGHSSGGGLALRFAGSAYGAQARGYLLLAPFLRHDAPTTRPNAGGWAKPRIGRTIALSVLNRLGIRALNGAIAIEFDMPADVRDGTETLAYSFRLNAGFAPREYRTDLAAIKVPLLVLVGANDEAFFADRYAATISDHAPDGEVSVLPATSHMGIAVKVEPANAIVRWLGRL